MADGPAQIFKGSKPKVDSVPPLAKSNDPPARVETKDPILPVINVGRNKNNTPEHIDIPLPEEDERFEEYTTDELFAALLRRIQREKAKVMLQAGYNQFQEIARRTTPAYATEQALNILREIADGQVRTAYVLENEKGNPSLEGPPSK